MDKIVDNVNNLVQAIENYGYGQQLLFQGDFSGSGAVKRKRRCEAETAGSVDRLRDTVKSYAQIRLQSLAE